MHQIISDIIGNNCFTFVNKVIKIPFSGPKSATLCIKNSGSSNSVGKINAVRESNLP